MGFIKTMVKKKKRKLLYIEDDVFCVFYTENYSNFYIDLHSCTDGKILTVYYNSDFEGFLQSIFKIEDLKK